MMMTTEQRMELIRTRLSDALSPQQIEVIDDGHLHIGHASAKGGGHFTVRIVAEAFIGKKLVERHRIVYGALADALQGEVHALSIQAKAPDEV